MDHLHIPEGCKPQAREIPYLGLAPKYDGLGFEGFPGRHEWDPDEFFIEDSVVHPSIDRVESFFQEWLWFGLMDEFGKACGIRINLEDFITDSPSGSGKIITMSKMYDVYGRRLAVRKLHEQALDLEPLEVDDLVKLPCHTPDLTAEQIVEVWKKRQADLGSDKETQKVKKVRARERLSTPYGDDVTCTDEIGRTIPLSILIHRISFCRILALDENGELTTVPQKPEDLEKEYDAMRKKLAAAMAQAQSLLYMIFEQKYPVV